MGNGFSALLRFPASASCLGRHSRLADRCAKNCSLFRPQAAVAILAFHGTCHEAFFKVFLYEGVNDQHGAAATMMEANLTISVSLFSSAKPPDTMEDWLALVELLMRMFRSTSGSGA